MSSQKKPTIPTGMKYFFGGLSGMGATSIVQPFDLVKTRMQISSQVKAYRSSFHCFASVFANEGPLAFYKGFGAALLRQATYTTGRMGVYTHLNEIYKANRPGEPPVLAQMVMGILAGASGAFIGTPAEVALIRMTSDGHLPLELRRNYTNVANALIRITKEEGILTLWRGCFPTVFRAMVVNMSQLASYSQAKNYLVKTFELEQGLKLHFEASMISGLICSYISLPIDILKTRLQNMKTIDGKPEYKGAFDVLVKILKNEGLFALWKGFTPYYGRIGPHTAITFIFMENLNNLYFKYVMGTTGGSTF